MYYQRKALDEEGPLYTRSNKAAEAEEWGLARHIEWGVPAVSFAVAGPGGLLWAEAFGKSDLERDLSAQSDHLFRLGSVSKIITATLAVRLAARGIVELDVPIAYWMPDLPPHHRRTTLQQLLTHTGGVRHYLPSDLAPDAPGGPITRREYNSREDILALFIEDELVAPPGTRVSYSSFGYSLASIILESASGRNFLGLIEDWIARPFGLASLCADEVSKDIPERVSGYFTAREVEMLAATFPDFPKPELQGGFAAAERHNPAFCWAGAGMLANMPELARFGANVLDHAASPITASERSMLFTPLTEASDSSPPLGLGWRIDEDEKGRPRWHHAGTTVGGRASVVIYPTLGLSIALASNTMATPGDVLGPSSELADRFG